MAGRRILRGGLPIVAAMLVVVVLVGAYAVGGATRLAAPLRMGYAARDDWEPAVASDGAGNVYVLITHFGGVPGCGGCADPTIMVQVSRDGGKSFSVPSPLTVSAAPQYDPQVKISADGPIYVSYLLGKDTVVQKSTDEGATWSTPVAVNAPVKNGFTDKDGLAVHSSSVYVGFDIAQKFFVASSRDAGATWSVAQINGKTLGWPLNGAAAVAPDGTVYMSWELVHKSGNAQGPQDVLVTKSTDGGANWTLSYADTNLPPGPACPLPCGWDFLGTGSSIAWDGAGTVYVLYNAPVTANGPPIVWFRASADGDATWSDRSSISSDGIPVFQVFPSIDAGAAGEVRVSWMDNRTQAYNVWYRSSSNSGSSWSSEVQVSQSMAGYSYITKQGFAFPYGDYYVLDLDPSGTVHVAWCEGPSYAGPGNVFYAHS